MLRFVAILCVIAFGLPIAFAQDASKSSQAPKPDKYALLVGITKYDHPSLNEAGLKFPEADVTAIGTVLEAGGYEVDYLLGTAATKKAIEKKLNTFSKRGGNSGVVFVGVFGHGIEFESTKLSYFCPFDTEIRNVLDSKGQKLFQESKDGRPGAPMTEPDPASMISIDSILNALTLSKATNRVLVADCCRDDPNRARGRSFGSSLQENRLPPKTVALFACDANQQAMEHDDWGHGAMTKCLLEQLNSDSQSGPLIMGKLVHDVQSSVSELVRKQSKGQKIQQPKFLITDRVDLLLPRRERLDERSSWITLDMARDRMKRAKEIMLKENCENPWDWAHLGDEKRTLETMRKIFADKNRRQMSDEEIGRVLGVLRQVKPSFDPKLVLQEVYTSARARDQFANTNEIASGLARPKNFVVSRTPEEALSLIELTESESDSISMILQTPKFMTGPRPASLETMLKSIGNIDGDIVPISNRLLSASVRDDKDEVKRILSHHEYYSTRMPYWTVPFVVRRDFRFIEEQVHFVEELFVACDAMLTSGHIEDARSLTNRASSLTFGSGKFGSIECFEGQRIPGGYEINHLPRSFSLFGQLSWLIGRLDQQSVESVLQGIQRDFKVKPLPFASGLLEDIPIELLKQVARESP